MNSLEITDIFVARREHDNSRNHSFFLFFFLSANTNSFQNIEHPLKRRYPTFLALQLLHVREHQLFIHAFFIRTILQKQRGSNLPKN